MAEATDPARVAGGGAGSVRRAWPTVVASFVVARVAVGVGFALSSIIVHAAPGWVRLDRRSEGLVAWDGGFYRQILSPGYGPRGSEGLRFFPLYPLIAKPLSWLVGADAALVLVANVAAIAAGWLLVTLVAEATGDDDLALRSAWWLALFPASAILVYAYAEALFLALSIAAVLAARRERWALALLAAFAGGLCRPIGVLVALPLIGVALAGDRDAPARRAWKAVGAVVAPAAGTLSYLVWVGATRGDWYEPIRIQSQLRAGFHEPVSRVVVAVADLVTGQFRDLPNVAFIVVLVAGLVAGWRRLPIWWSLYALSTLVVAASAHVIDSVGRYGLAAFPFVVGVALLDRRLLRWPLGPACSALAMVGFVVVITVRGVVP